jgi:hypothetical protein
VIYQSWSKCAKILIALFFNLDKNLQSRAPIASIQESFSKFFNQFGTHKVLQSCKNNMIRVSHIANS